uniref:Uncharacterized protein n=1 Tax=Timema cristinae TaxID=61476 RepID=A0A7R9D9K6_TIMCR|nr:unnamed protein product [Timema cristinae]
MVQGQSEMEVFYPTNRATGWKLLMRRRRSYLCASKSSRFARHSAHESCVATLNFTTSETLVWLNLLSEWQLYQVELDEKIIELM